MAEGQKNGPADPETCAPPLSAIIASRGICTAPEAARFCSALLGDIMNDAVPPRKAGAACNALGKLYKAVELQQRYGGANGDPLKLADLTTVDQVPLTPQQQRLRLLKQLADLESGSTTDHAASGAAANETAATSRKE